MTTYEMEKIKTMRQQGLGYGKIGQILGISNSAVRSFCRRNGLTGDAPQNTVLCQHCGKTIPVIPKRKPRKFCSDACRTAWWNNHPGSVNRKAVYNFTCACCGEHFTAYGNRNRKYCSHSCYIADRYQRGVSGND